MSQIDVPPLPKLPLGETISLSYAWFFQKFADVLRVSWLWLMLCIVLFGIENWLHWSWLTAAFAHASKGATHFQAPALPLGLGFLMMLAWLAMMFGTTSVAVAWHRRILLNEQPGLSGRNVASRALWRYIGIGIAITLITILPIAIVMFPTMFLLAPAQGSQPDAAFFLMIPIIFVIYIAALAIMLRLSVLLPARAIGDTALTFGQAWRRTRGNTWRMFWGLLACSIPPLIVLEIISAVVWAAIGTSKLVSTDGQMPVPPFGLIMMSAIMFVLSLLIVPIYIGFLSHSYRHFFQGGIDVDELI